MTNASYVHLHNHTHYSLLDGVQKVPAMLDRVKELGMDAIALTDHGTLSGAIEFYKEATARGIKPIIGIETYVASRGHTDKDPAKDKGRFHLILLAMNNRGYENLMRLSSIANLQGFYHKPRIDHELLEKYNEGLICLSGCIGGEVGEALRSGQDEQGKEIAAWYKQVFGDRYYLELQDHEHLWAEQKLVNDKLLKIADELDIPAVITCDAHYLLKEDQEAHEALLCVQTGSFLADQDRMSLKEFELYLTEPKDIIKRWQKRPELITNTRAIADRCKVELQFGKYLIPKFSVPKGQDEKSYLDLQTYQGLVRRYAPGKHAAKTVAELKKLLEPRIIERAEYELGIIDRMGFNGYFLIVQDFIIWGKDKGIIFGPGRGSGASSIVAYALRITELDPLAYDLLFERFLNPDRISMPDFDIDIQDSRRDEVIRYCVDKYGEDRVANIATFGTMAARNAIRDVSRVLQVSYADADRLAKLVPPPVQGRHIPLKTSIKEDPDLRAEYAASEQNKRVMDLAVKLEGTIRSHGVHAAGVVIAPDELVKFAPLEMAQKGVVATQYSGGPIEDLGLLKMDFLGLSNLTIINNALRIIRRVEKVDLAVEAIPLDDAKTYDLLTRGLTTGVFQLESAGMKRYLKELKPTVFEDIISMVALYRPGPMQWIDDFIDRKHGRKPITYLHPAMKPALESTYGVIVTQEQVMQISKEMCGFSGGQADTLRKAIGKKIPEVMRKLKNDFIDGAIQTVGADKKLMEKLWKQLEDFAAYCFNKAHSACYAMIAYWTAYLKANYPEAYMAALMTSDYDDTDRLAIEIKECNDMGLAVLPPDINQSYVEFGVVPGTNQIRFGLSAIKNVGVGAVETIIQEREQNGEFASIEDFVRRVNTRVVNRKVWESLIKTGAFDRFGQRSDLLFSLDDILGFGARFQKDTASGQIDLFGESAGIASEASHLKIKTNPTPVGERDWLQWERELLGVYLSSHPLEPFQVFLEEKTIPIRMLSASHEGQTITIGGIISAKREIMTKSGQKMAFVRISDLEGEMELIAFPKLYNKDATLWENDKVILATGKLSSKDREGKVGGELKLLPDSVEEISIEAVQSYIPVGKRQSVPAGTNQSGGVLDTLYMQLQSIDDQDKLKQIKSLLEAHPGPQKAVVVVGVNDQKRAIRLPFGVTISESVTSALRDLLGNDCVVTR